MKKQNYNWLPNAARNAITMLVCVIALFSSINIQAQVYDPIACPLNIGCDGFTNFNAGSRDTICLNEVLTLRGFFSSHFNGTTLSWTDVSPCMGVTIASTPIGTSTAIVGIDTIFYGNYTFSTPGVYLFKFTGSCIDYFYTEPVISIAEDTVRIVVLPIPTANAGIDTLSCSRDAVTYGYDTPWFAQLNATPVLSGEVGTWSWINQVGGTSYEFLDVNDPHTIFTVGGYGGTHKLVWSVVGANGCINRDTVNIYIPAEQMPWAASDTVCTNSYHLIVNQNHSSPGAFTNPLAYDSALTTSDPTFYTFYQTSGPLGAAPAVITTAINPWIYVSTPGYYTFVYWLHGLCINDTAHFSIYFQTGSPNTNVVSMNHHMVCDTTDTVKFENNAPNPLWGETSLWELDPGLIAVGDTVNIDSLLITWDGVTPLPISFTYTIFGPGGVCPQITTCAFHPPIIPIINAMNDTVLLCGINYSNANYEILDVNTGLNLHDNSVSSIDMPVLISQPLGSDSVIVSLGNPTSPYPPPLAYYSFQINFNISNMNVPGVYAVLLHVVGRCGTHTYDTVNFTLSAPPDASNAGLVVSLHCGQEITTLQGNTPIAGMGTWNTIGLPPWHPDFTTPSVFDMNISPDTVSYTTISGFDIHGIYYFDWVICNPACPAPSVEPYFDGCYHNSTFVIVPDTSGNTAIAGNDTTLCDTTAFQLYTLGIQLIPGTWSQLASNPDSVTISNPTAHEPYIYGFNSSGIYGFVWTVTAGCGNLSDTMYVTYEPEKCCFAMNNLAYHQWIGDTTISQNFVMSGKYYIDGIITVNNNATLDITNVDLVFATCAGINFENGTTIRANNSVFRACNLQDSWRGLAFADSTFGVIENCSFKNAHRAVDMLEGNVTVRVFNNTFANNFIGINTSTTHVMEAITGNTFTIDNSFVDFYKGICAETDTFYFDIDQFYVLSGYYPNYGINAYGSIFYGLISQNNFINGSDPDKNHLFFGIVGIEIVANITNNNFSNLFRSIDIGYSNDVNIFNNKMDVHSITSYESVINTIQIRLTNSSYCKISNNTITVPFVYEPERFTLFDFGIVYLENNNNTIITDNIIKGGLSSISMFTNTDTYVSKNKIQGTLHAGIVSLSGLRTDIYCNEIDLYNTQILGNSIGIYIINAYEDSISSGSCLIRNNCILNSKVGIDVHASCRKLPFIYNNFLYNYEEVGIYADAIGDIGNAGYQGRNTFISNNAGNGAIDVYAPSCNINTGGNYGLSNMGGSVTVLDNSHINSTAGCAHQITEMYPNEFNYPLNMNSLTDCEPYRFDTDSTLYKLINIGVINPQFNGENNNWYEQEKIFKTVGLINILAAQKNTVELNLVYTNAKNSGMLDKNEIVWLNYYYNFAINKFQEANSYLQQLNCTGEAEKHLQKLETIKCKMRIEGIKLQNLPAEDMKALTDISETNYWCSAIANDYLKLALNGHDYPFKRITMPELDLSKKTKKLADNTVNLYPNPANDIVTIDFVLNGKENGQLYLYDVSGTLVLQKTLPYLTGKTNINIGNLANGMYLLMIKQDGEMISQSKLIKK